MAIKKEWLYQLIVLLIFYLNLIIHVHDDGVHYSCCPVRDLLFLLYHAALFILVNYLLLPKLFYAKRYALFLASLIALIAFFGVVEETVVEKILAPNSKGRNPLTWQSIYWYFGEIIVPLLTFMVIKLGFDHFEKQQKLERIEKDNLSNELKLLKSQIQPHILFNSLNNLYNSALSKSDRAPELILKLSNVLRYVLYETTTEKVSLDKELAFVKDYVDLQKVQFEGRGNISYEVEKGPKSEQLSIAPFMLIPFIENSFKHSFGTIIENVDVNISISISEKQLRLFVNNNFESASEKGDELLSHGIGLKNVQKRLDLLYPNDYSLTIDDSNLSYKVFLKLELGRDE